MVLVCCSVVFPLFGFCCWVFVCVDCFVCGLCVGSCVLSVFVDVVVFEAASFMAWCCCYCCIDIVLGRSCCFLFVSNNCR